MNEIKEEKTTTDITEIQKKNHENTMNSYMPIDSTT